MGSIITMALQEIGIDDKVQIVKSGAYVSLQDILTGVLVDLGVVDVIRICGSLEAYVQLQGILKKVNVIPEEVPEVTSKLVELAKVFKG